MPINYYRHCNCNSNMNSQPSCSCDMNDSNTINTQSSNCPMEEHQNTVDCDLQKEMISQIQSLDFAITELGLYLDTHPEDERALCLHRKYTRENKTLKDKYQKVYGPLTINFPCNKWRWLEEPWPWERGNF